MNRNVANMSMSLFHGPLVASGTELLINLLAVKILFLVSCDVTESGGQSGLQQFGTVLLIEQRSLWVKAIS
jgi:hypothetical protein